MLFSFLASSKRTSEVDSFFLHEGLFTTCALEWLARLQNSPWMGADYRLSLHIVVGLELTFFFYFLFCTHFNNFHLSLSQPITAVSCIDADTFLFLTWALACCGAIAGLWDYFPFSLSLHFPLTVLVVFLSLSNSYQLASLPPSSFTGACLLLWLRFHDYLPFTFSFVFPLLFL